MEEDQKKEIEKIIGQLDCPKHCKCYKSGFEHLCKAEDIGLTSLLKCLEEDHKKCAFSVAFGLSVYCECPLRLYIARKLKR